jgi:hypothetical protein
MALNLAKMHAFIVKEVASKRSLRASMDRLIDKCAKGHPHADWKKLAALPYENLKELSKWIEKPFRSEPSRPRLAGLWFGLFNPCYDDETAADMYVCGSKRFHDRAGDNSWAVHPAWFPKHCDAHSSVLAKLYTIAYPEVGGLENDAEYPLCLAYASLAVRDLLRAADPSLFLGKSKSLGIAVGFDSGDFILVGKLSKSGLDPLS